ncbi:MAG TPA: hypothetical protein HA364_07665 [Thermoplasmata archaeon]|nr:hypothetical protein [Thermoplasmata archaeon]
MASEGSVNRDMVLDSMSRTLMPLGYVHALWEGGAISHGRLDEWSDIDLYVLVDDDKVREAFDAIEGTLTSLSPIAIKYDIGQTPYPGVHQAFYRLERTSKFLVLDIAVVTQSAPDKFLEEKTHGKQMFLFRKSMDLHPPVLDVGDLRDKVRKRISRLRLRMDLFHVFVQKELNRGHLIEAVDAYTVIVLGSLTELLRIRYNPVHHEFKTRYLYSELPLDVIKKLEGLYLIKDSEDLELKYVSARQWFDDVHGEIVAIGPDRLVGL